MLFRSNDTATTEIYTTANTLSLHDALPIFDDPAGDHDWGISATVDLAASDEAGVAVLQVTGVNRL